MFICPAADGRLAAVHLLAVAGTAAVDKYVLEPVVRALG